jgi:hypothetical protein
MQWIEGVVHDGDRYVTRLVDQHGVRSTGRIEALHASLPPRSYMVASAADVDLFSLRPMNPKDYLWQFGLRNADPAGQQIFLLVAAGRRLCVPTAVLLQGLLTTFTAVGKYLLSAGGLDQLAQPVLENGHLSFPRPIGSISEREQDTVAWSRMPWLTCYPSARRMWASVYDGATKGRLTLEPPRARVSAKFFGRCDSGIVYVTRVSIGSIEADEEPLSFAHGCVPRRFDLPMYRSRSSADVLTEYRAHANLPELKRQADIPLGPHGARMSYEEWLVVSQKMRLLGFAVPDSAMNPVNLALEKHSSGKTWTSMGVAKGNLTLYSNWLRNGKWDALKGILSEIRE